jgi:hypothetical protein
MQTFLPFSNFKKSASVLDTRRLGKQRVETLQILNALHGLSKGWVNHPATKMWKGYTQALVLYGVAICEHWIELGYNDTCMSKITSFKTDSPVLMPLWLGGKIHTTHRSALLFKNYEFYSKFNWKEEPIYDYYWPSA